MNYKNLLLLALGILSPSGITAVGMSWIKKLSTDHTQEGLSLKNKKAILFAKKDTCDHLAGLSFMTLAGYGIKACSNKYHGKPFGFSAQHKFFVTAATALGSGAWWKAQELKGLIKGVRAAKKAHNVQLATERTRQQELAEQEAIATAVQEALEKRDQEQKEAHDAAAAAEAKRQKAAEDLIAPEKRAIAEGKRLVLAVAAARQQAMPDAEITALNNRDAYYGTELTQQLTEFILRDNPLDINPAYREEVRRHLAIGDYRLLSWSGISEPVKIMVILHSELLKNVVQLGLSNEARNSARNILLLMEYRNDAAQLYEKIRWNPAIFSEKLLTVEENLFLQKP